MQWTSREPFYRVRTGRDQARDVGQGSFNGRFACLAPSDREAIRSSVTAFPA
ncbi:hypothetical protein [Paraburkholderia fungorum]|uniref:hypothetical protein n=1 Tax=Paraburkholderia fungorum TaxID=134537 RepID=UPI00402BD5F8